MGSQRIRYTAWGIALLTLGFALYAFAAQDRVLGLGEADRLYNEKSYAGALRSYEQLLQAGEVPAGRRDEVLYRIAVSLGKTKQWDRALEQSLEFVETHRGSNTLLGAKTAPAGEPYPSSTVWEPRGLYWLGRLYLAVPHQGYRVGQRIYRGSDVPKTDQDARPEQVAFFEQDRQNAEDALEAARVTFGGYRSSEHTEAEEIQLDFDLARVLQESPRLYLWAEKREWAPPSDPAWGVQGTESYSPDWPPPKKIAFLFAQIGALAPAGSGREHSAALALLGESLWLPSYHGLMSAYAWKWENEKQIHLPYPYEPLKPETPLRRLIREYPNDPIRDQAQYTLAQLLTGEGRMTEALAEYRRLIEQCPASKWVADARLQIQGITRRDLSLSASGPQMPGAPAHLTLQTRNLSRLHLDAYRVKLEDAIARPEALSQAGFGMSQFPVNLGNLKGVRRLYGARVASWDLSTPDRGDYQYQSEQVTVPEKETGAYVVEASAQGVKSATVMVLTDLTLVQKVHRDGVLLFAADARGGRPVRNAKVVVKQTWYEGGREHSSAARSSTDGDGIASVPLQRGPGRSSFSVEALAYRGNRYALTQRTWGQDTSDNPEIFKIYSTTDRAVYRPMQRVYYRELVMRRERGELRPVANRQVQVEVRDPQGQLVYAKTESASEFGSVNGHFELPEEAPLGEYSIDATVPEVQAEARNTGGNRFRVEEYKKPEFEVKVTPAAERVRLGQPASAHISAQYYFGGPVSQAKVSFRVYRSYYTQSYRFPRPFDFLYQYDSAGDYNTAYRNGAVVAQGETHTDEKGEATISFQTGVETNLPEGADFSYTVDADVQDASRRVISGSGAVKATRHDVSVFLDYPHGYATAGDHLDVEIVTLNPSDQPVSAAGAARVFRQPEAPGGKERLVTEAPLRTDSHGRAIFRWTADSAGYFRIAFVTRDSTEQEVSGSTFVWVQGPELERGRFLFQNIALRVENPYYEEGQTARVLVITPAPDCTVLLTREANNQILDRRVLRVSGHSLELKLPLSRQDVPNVHLSATMVRDGKIYQAVQELFVPPVRQFTTVTVTADRERYRPGEKATLQIRARDWQGRPLRTELSVAVTDAALGYIQRDYAPDIRVFFHGDRRSQSVAESGSTGATFASYQEDTQPAGQFQTHEWVLPEGMGQLLDWPGADGGYRRSDILNLYSERAYAGSLGDRGGIAGGLGGFGGRFAALQGRMPMSAAAAVDAAKPAHANNREEASESQLDKRRDLGSGLAEAQVRSRFADTAFWTPAVVTDADGNASVQVTWPGNLTQWRAMAVGTSAAAQVGSGEARVATKKDLLVRLQAPRFFVERDEVVVSANVHNYLSRDTRARVRLELEDAGMGVGYSVLGVGIGDGRSGSQGPTPNTQHPILNNETWVEIPKDGEKRLDWTLRVEHAGKLRIRMTAQSPEEADAAEMSFPVIVHGVERAVAQSGALREPGRAQLAIELPAARKPGSSELVVQLTPSLGATMLDALPYLADYPYGCIEQTMSRFLPAVVVAKTLKDAGYDLEALGRRARLMEARASEGGSSGVKNSPYTYPRGRPGTVRLPALASDVARSHNPVFDSQALRNMVETGLGRVRQFQHEDGGWGWWPGDSSDPYMTAYVLYGLLTARDAGYPVDAGRLDRGLGFLKGRFLEDDNLHRMAYEARVLAMEPRYRALIRELATGRLFERRERLSAYSKALLALALHDLGEAEKASVLLRNLESTAKIDAANGTASWDEGSTEWWRWYHNKVETNAAVLQAYEAIAPKSELPAMLVKWLVNNRRGSIWSSTRETAMAVYALADFVRVNRELDPEYTVTVDLGGRVKRSYTVTRENALFFDNRFIVPDELLQSGKQTLEIRKEGPGALYYTAYTRYFSLEEPIRSAGNEISVQRRYFRLLPGTASGTPETRPLDTKRPNPFLTGQYELLSAGGEWVSPEPTEGGPRYERTALKDGDTVASGDLLEVELQLDSKNDYDYLVFEDLKPAGCEPVELRSGFHAGSGVYSNMELRDQKVAFFLSSLPQGRRTLSYRLRAEIPGRFHVLPTNGYAMYAPDIRAISDETRLEVRDRSD